MPDPNLPPQPNGPQPTGIQARPRPVVETGTKTDIVPLQRGGAGSLPSRTNPPTAAKKPESDFRDSVRELLETIVFVVVLVLLLKTFLAEAFVIPTGSMAVTLLGYHKEVPCEQCGRPMLVNFSQEVDPPRFARPMPTFGCICENCQFPNVFQRPDIPR